jgi:hypothetical protein
MAALSPLRTLKSGVQLQYVELTSEQEALGLFVGLSITIPNVADAIVIPVTETELSAVCTMGSAVTQTKKQSLRIVP